MKKMNCKQTLLLLLFGSNLLFWSVHSFAQIISINLVNVPVVNAVKLLAHALNCNVIINPAIQGSITLQLKEVPAQQALNLLLLTQGLAKWQQGDLWYIGFSDEITKRKEEEIKWLLWKDENAARVFKVWQVKYGSAQDIVNLLKDDHNSLFSKNGIIRVDNRTNSIFVYETEEKIRNIAALIQQLDISIDQVLIEARVVSIDQDCERELGINFASKTETEAGHHSPDGKIDTGQFSIVVATLADRTLLDVKLVALERAGRAELISTPSLFTGNLQTASIEAGEEVPYQEVSESGGTAVVFKKAVLALKVTPHILPGNRVLLRLQINQDRPSNKMVLGVPTISTRQITTHVLAKNGQTMVLGGIFESNHESGYQGLPYLSQIPILNIFFKQQNRRVNRRKLLIFITPKIT